VTVPAFALAAGAATKVVIATSTAVIIDSFFMLFFYSSSYDLVYLCVSLTHLTIVPKKALSVKFSLATYYQ